MERTVNTSTSFLSVDELASIDVIELGNVCGSVRLETISSSAQKSSYVSPFSLRDPVILRFDRACAEVRQISNGSTLASLQFHSISKIDVSVTACSLRIRGCDDAVIGVTIHDNTKLMTAFKVLSSRCHGAISQHKVEDLQGAFERQNKSSRISEKGTSPLPARGRAHLTSIVGPLQVPSPSKLPTEAPLPQQRTIQNRTAKTPVKNFNDPSKVEIGISITPNLAAREERRELLRCQLEELRKRAVSKKS